MFPLLHASFKKLNEQRYDASNTFQYKPKDYILEENIDSETTSFLKENHRKIRVRTKAGQENIFPCLTLYKIKSTPHACKSQIFSPCGPKNLHNSNQIFTPSHFKLAQFLTSHWKWKKRYCKTKIKNSVPFFSILRYPNLGMHSWAAVEGNKS